MLVRCVWVCARARKALHTYEIHMYQNYQNYQSYQTYHTHHTYRTYRIYHTYRTYQIYHAYLIPIYIDLSRLPDLSEEEEERV